MQKLYIYLPFKLNIGFVSQPARNFNHFIEHNYRFHHNGEISNEWVKKNMYTCTDFAHHF